MAYDALVSSDVPTLKLTGILPNYEASISTWPWPRLYLSNYHLFSLTRHADGNLYLSECIIENGQVLPTVMGSLGSAAAIDTVDIADFGPYYVIATNGLSGDAVPVPVMRTYIKDIAATNYPFLLAFSGPIFGTVCNYQGQLVAGNIVNNVGGLWTDLRSDGILWSEIGSMELDPTVAFTAGFMRGQFSSPIGRTPTIYKLMPMWSRYLPGVVVYSDAGRFLLSPEKTETGFVYGMKAMGGFGILSGNHIDGDDFIQGFIDTYKDFWLLESPHFSSPPEGNYKKLGYRDYIQELFDFKSSEDSRVIVSYISRNKRFYISNGNKCLIINEFGACHIFQCVSSVVKGTDGRLYGTFKTLPDRRAFIVSDEIDFGSRGLKMVEAMTGGLSAVAGAGIRYTVDWRTSVQSPWTRLPWRNVNPRGEARIGVTSPEFRLLVEISDYTEAEIEWLAVNVKFPDNRFKRGPSLAEANLISMRNE